MVSLSLDWSGGLRFANSAGSPSIEFASSTPGVTSPPQAVAYALMGCMGMDVVHVIEKGRYRLDRLTVRFEGERAHEQPRRFLKMAVHFDITTEATAKVVERAIHLSREKYCSVWHTLRPDVELTTTFTIHHPADEATWMPGS